MPTPAGDGAAGLPRRRFPPVPALLLCALLALGSGSCGCATECAVCDSDVSKVEIVPSVIYADGGATFEVEARARNQHRIVLEARPAQWSVPAVFAPHVEFDPLEGNPTTVRIGDFDALPGAAGKASVAIEGLRAVIDGKAGVGAVIVSAPVASIPEPARPDRVVLASSPSISPDPGAAARPSVVSLSARFPTGCRQDSLAAIVSLMHFEGDVRAPSGCPGPSGPRAAVFSSGAEADVGPTAWADGLGDEMKRQLARPLRIPVALWNGLSEYGTLEESQIQALLKGEVNKVNDSLRRSLSGLVFEVPADVGRPNGTVFHSGGCDPGSVAAFLGSGFDPAEAVIHIVYVDAITSGGGDDTGLNGMNCPAQAGAAYGLVAVKGLSVQALSLGHELGHALALNRSALGSDEGGHTHEETPGFDCANYMWTGAQCTRDRFTLGQLYRMNWQAAPGWLNHAKIRPPSASVDCKDPAAACPPMSLDFAPPTEP